MLKNVKPVEKTINIWLYRYKVYIIYSEVQSTVI